MRALAGPATRLRIRPSRLNQRLLSATTVTPLCWNSRVRAVSPASRSEVPRTRTRRCVTEAINAELSNHNVDLVLLLGYMRKLGPAMLGSFRNRILNIHPALLPEHGGKGRYGIHVHESVLASGDTETGVSIHVVSQEYDQGPRHCAMSYASARWRHGSNASCPCIGARA